MEWDKAISQCAALIMVRKKQKDSVKLSGSQPFLPKQIGFITAEELLQRYPDRSAKERENAIAKEMGAVFIQGIGACLSYV